MAVMLDLDREIQKVLAVKETDFPLISFYLDTRVSDKTGYEKKKVLLKHKLNNKVLLFRNENKKYQSIVKDAEKIRFYVENQIKEKTEGVAIFACSHENVFCDFQFALPFEDQIIVNGYPHIKPLLEIQHDTQKIIAVMVDSRSARIFDIACGALKLEERIEDYVPSRLKSGGCSQLRFQHHVEDHILRHLKHVIAFLEDLFMKENEKIAGIILSGQSEILATLKKELPKQLKQRIIAEESFDIRKQSDKVLTLILADLRKRENLREKDLITNIRTKSLSTDLGAAGLSETVEALNNKRPFVMVMDKNLKAEGFICGECGKVFIYRAIACPYCSSEKIKVEKDLPERILREAQKEKVKIHLMSSSKELEGIGGIGALLKYK
ncbi:MAG: Vms1/Ankzf1 family peptidyl-tRNA hydrolase [Candidatus Omnitrophota bacterium]